MIFSAAPAPTQQVYMLRMPVQSVVDVEIGSSTMRDQLKDVVVLTVPFVPLYPWAGKRMVKCLCSEASLHLQQCTIDALKAYRGDQSNLLDQLVDDHLLLIEFTGLLINPAGLLLNFMLASRKETSVC